MKRWEANLEYNAAWVRILESQLEVERIRVAALETQARVAQAWLDHLRKYPPQQT
ncbi:hypothetical protein [Microbacterium sp. BH-3-3-3]|uniref:hypothetical protein n=1 Tax=Microbacterium sp. BH-3-3-3 TaxID=1906742 RepID=UPI0012E9EDC9|nr:hypothetical protein [Microbacterium sp. BH-3-3-3]